MRNKRERHSGFKNKAIIVLLWVSIVLVGLVYFFADSFRSSGDFDWDSISTPTKNVVFSLEGGPIPSIAYRDSLEDREWIIRNTSEEELLRLLEYPIPVIRATAYEGLLRRGHSDAYNLLLKAFNDKGEFSLYITKEGHKRHYKIGEYLVDEVLLLDLTMNLPPRSDQKKLDYNFSEKEIKVIDSLYAITTSKYL